MFVDVSKLVDRDWTSPDGPSVELIGELKDASEPLLKILVSYFSIIIHISMIALIYSLL